MTSLLSQRFALGLLAASLTLGGAWAQSSDATKKKAAPKSTPKAEAKSTAKHPATVPDVTEGPLTPEELVMAQRILTGKIPCELGAHVTITADDKMPGYFHLSIKNLNFHMFPVASATGAIRLEDRKNGAVWLQLGNKSMLMSQKLGIRLADACVTPEQAVVQAAMDKLPPVNLLEGPAKPKAAAASAATATVVTTTTTTTTTTTYAVPTATAASGIVVVPAAPAAAPPAAAVAAPAPAAPAPAVVVVPVPAAAVASAAAGAVVAVPAAPAPGASAPTTVLLVPAAPVSAPKK